MSNIKLLFLAILFSTFSFAQVGVNTTEIDQSAALDIRYGATPKGLLMPRMMTSERIGITTPADGLIVYDTDLKSFYHYQNKAPAGWVKMSGDVNGRTNFKRIKSTDVLETVLAAEKIAGGTTYKLDPSTYYEINGAVTFDAPIELNNAYLVGLDANEDKLLRTGNLFVGATGGTIKNLTVTVTGGDVFTLIGSGNTQSLLLRDCIVQQCSNVGTISGFGLVFSSVVQYVGNGGGIIYNNITRLLLSNIGWFGNNAGTFETYTGSFSLIQKLGGFMDLTSGTFGVDVSTNPTITGDAVLESVVFTGGPTSGAKYVNSYNPRLYTGYNFNGSWAVDSPGIPREGDAAATGNLYKTNNDAITTVAASPNVAYAVLAGATTGTNLFRVNYLAPTTVNPILPARLYYAGKKARTFQVSATISFEASGGTGNTDYVFYFSKILPNGTLTALPETETYLDTNSSNIQAFPVSGTVVLAEGESVALYLRRISGPLIPKTDIKLRSYNLSIK